MRDGICHHSYLSKATAVVVGPKIRMMFRLLQMCAGLLVVLTLRWLFRALRQDRTRIQEEALMTDGHIQQIDGIGVHYRREGAGLPVVLVHGLIGSTRTWSAASSKLSDKMSAISVDLPGSGLSAKPPDFDYSPRAQGEVLAKFIQQTCVETAVLVASSAGARVALHAASASQGNVRLIVLLSPIVGAYLPLDWKSSGGVLETRMLELALSSRRLLRLVIRSLSRNSPAADRAAEAIFMEARTSGYVAALQSSIGVLLNGGSQIPTGKIKVPVRCVVGARDPLAAFLGHDTLLALAADASVTVLPRCGHMVELQAPAQVSNLIERFIDELN